MVYTAGRFETFSSFEWLSMVDKGLYVQMRTIVKVLNLTVALLAILVMGDVRISIAQDGGNYRGAFTSFLANPPSGANIFTVVAVWLSNEQLAKAGVPMTKSHFIVATKSIANGDDIYKFLLKENPEVLKSTGQGLYYYFALSAHYALWAYVTFFDGQGDGGGKSKGLSLDSPWDTDLFKTRNKPWVDLGLW